MSAFPRAANPGMPGPYPGRVVSLRSADCVDVANDKVNQAAVREMMARGMCALTGTSQPRDAWGKFIAPSDIVAIKVNCVGWPFVYSSPEVIAEIVRNLLDIGVETRRIFLYDRIKGQLDDANYAPHLPPGVECVGAETRPSGPRLYDPSTYVEVNFFGEEDTRSNMVRLLRDVTKIINVPVPKDHSAGGATGCLKNIAYGSFSNVDRSHARAAAKTGKTHCYSFIGTLASVEPVRSRTVLQIMDGLRGVWHQGPFCRTPRYMFYPKRMLFGTDPVAIDRLLLDLIDDQRKAQGAISIFDRSPENLRPSDNKAYAENPNVNIFVREPLHVEYASTLGLGVYDIKKIRTVEIRV